MLSLFSAAALLAGVASASPYPGLSDYIVAAGDTPAGGLAANAASGSSSAIASATSSVAVPSTSNRAEPCAQVAKLVAAQAASGVARFDPGLALQCLRSVPLDVEGNKKQLLGVQTLAQFQSTLNLLKDPMEGYPYPGVDIVGGLEDLSSKLDNGSYDNEYDFQLDLYDLIRRAYDEHFNYVPDITSVIQFIREDALYSLSVDGEQLPAIYSYRDLKVLAYSNLTNYTVSPIAKINGQPADEFLREFGDHNGQAQDKDANYNAVLTNIPHMDSGNLFRQTTFYQGNETVYEFKNGSVRRDQNLAGTASDFTGVVDGKTFFQKFCSGAAPIQLAPTNSTNTTVSASASVSASITPTTTAVHFTAVPQQTSVPAPIFYPEPWAISEGFIACYFPEAEPDLMVLSIPDIHPLGSLAELQFTNTARSCLATAAQKQKTRLVIDLRGNGGGIVLLAFDLFKQLFPSQTPYGATNFRTFPLFNDIGQIITEEYEDVSSFNRTRQDYVNGYNSIFNANEGLDAHLDDYDSWAEFYGPVEAYGANFTHLLRYNLSDAYELSGSTVSGYGNLTNVTPEQVFKAEDIILLQDGICASTCAVFSEFMKSQGHVQQVVMGGRAQTGPMQGVGGVKGANVYPAEYLRKLVGEAYKVASPDRQKELETTYATEMETFPQAIDRVARDPKTGALSARVNVRNNIRQGDESLTPLQFVYEAADCRLWYTPQMILDQSLVWKAAYEARWNGGKMCVEGSTGQKSSGFGVDYFPGNGTDGAADGSSGTSPTGTEAAGGAPTNGAGVVRGGGLAALMGALVMVIL